MAFITGNQLMSDSTTVYCFMASAINAVFDF